MKNTNQIDTSNNQPKTDFTYSFIGHMLYIFISWFVGMFTGFDWAYGTLSGLFYGTPLLITISFFTYFATLRNTVIQKIISIIVPIIISIIIMKLFLMLIK